MTAFTPDLACAQALDRQDPIGHLRQHYYPLPDNRIYMDGNSLGLCSKQAEAAVLRMLEEWKQHGIDLWTANEAQPNFLYQDTLGSKLAALIKADPKEVTCCTNTTINIHQCIATFYRPTKQRFKILIDDLNFPTDRYAVVSQVKLHGQDPADAVKIVASRDGRMVEEQDIIDAMTDDVAIAFFPAVYYRSAQLLDMKRLTEEARRRGILIGFDLCHSIGAVDHNMRDVDCDFAVWCNYKYISGGPGAIAGLYINARHFDKDPGLAGWHGGDKSVQMDFLDEFVHERSAGGWQTGTQPMLSMAATEGALEVFALTDMEAIRAKSLLITEYLMYLIDEKLGGYGFVIGNPREDARRGGHVALEHEEAIRICAALKARGVIPDFRPPRIIRLAPVAMYVTYEETHRLVGIIEDIMKNKEYEKFANKRGIVA